MLTDETAAAPSVGPIYCISQPNAEALYRTSGKPGLDEVAARYDLRCGDMSEEWHSTIID
jgi:hypothetical protein